MDIKKQCRLLEKDAPPLTKKELSAINALFPSYIFRRRRTREVWATCCGKYGVLKEGSPILAATHTPEPKIPHYCYHGYLSAPPPNPKPEPMACPFCGKVSPVKELGRTGKRDNLHSYRRCVVLRWHRNVLWGMAYEMSKTYTESQLTAMPRYTLCAIYKFIPGKAVKASRSYWDKDWGDFTQIQTSDLKPGFKFREPFNACHEYGMGYDVIRAEEINKSPFRWCGFAAYAKAGSELMRYLALCTAYPRQVEMLTKAGLVSAVVDFVVRNKRNALAFNWYEEDPVKAFGLSKAELLEFLAGDKDLDVLARYKLLRKAGIPASLTSLGQFRKQLTTVWFNRAVSKMVKYHLSQERLTHYLLREGTAMKGRKKRGPDLSQLAGWWVDYIDAAEVLGYDLRNPVFLTPKALMGHHDEATKAASVVKEARHKDNARKKEASRLRNLTRRYTYTDGRWLIRPPLGAAEIVAEGKALCHCVGGYADRHIAGTCTILFLRDRQRPGHHLVTIQMHGNEIVQIHGWDNDLSKCKDNPKLEDPRKLYAEFLEPWLAWLSAGSPRDKEGRPVVPAKEKPRHGVA